MSVTHYSSLEALAEIETPTATWWLSVARALDDLDERLAEDAVDDGGPTGSFTEAVSRAPALASATARLTADHSRLADRVVRLRRLVAQVAGDARQAPAVSAELATLAQAEQNYRRRSRMVFWDSFTRDIGGE